MKQIKKILLFQVLLRTLLLLTIIPFCASSCHHSQKTNEQSEAKLDSNNNDKDVQFLVSAAENDLKEIYLGILAQEKGGLVDVKELGGMMETMHRKSLKGLKEIARKKLVIIPTSLSDNLKNKYKSLSNESGIYFDKKYCEMMIIEHQTSIAMYERASKESKDVEIREWAKSMLPTLRKHLDGSIICQNACNKML